MASFQLQIKGLPPKTLGPKAPAITVGRSPQNDWVIEDATLSRQHARIEWVDVAPGDELILGTLRVEVALLAEPTVRIDREAPQDPALDTFTMPAAKVRSGADRDGGQWSQALTFMHDLTLGLIQDVTPQDLLETLLDKLMHFLKADRGVVLLKDPQGAIRPSVARIRGTQRPDLQISLSHTLVEAAVDRREALNDPQLASRSLILSGVTTAIVSPLEAEGEVIGLLYFDSHSLLKQFTRDDLQLVATLAHVAAAKIQGARLLAEVRKSRALEQEMGIARRIQRRMLPKGSPGEGPFSLHAELRSAKEVGGDLYDYHWQDGQVRFCIGDVSGKGVPAALVMALTRTLFRATGAFLDDPARLMAAVNNHICEGTGSGIFVTAFCGSFDPASGRLVYCNAGHEPPAVLAPERPSRFLEVRPGLALGILKDYPYQAQETVFGGEELLLLYTDGVTEAMNPALEPFTSARLQFELDLQNVTGPEAVVRQVLGAVDRFAGGAPQADDITLMCLQRRRVL